MIDALTTQNSELRTMLIKSSEKSENNESSPMEVDSEKDELVILHSLNLTCCIWFYVNMHTNTIIYAFISGLSKYYMPLWCIPTVYIWILLNQRIL